MEPQNTRQHHQQQFLILVLFFMSLSSTKPKQNSFQLTILVMYKPLPIEDLMGRDQFDTLDNDCGSAVKNCTSNKVVLSGSCDTEGEKSASGICSPPLWKTSSPQNLTNYSHLSAAAKAQAVARGQEELMEMIKNMPESSYELSLKDIVEHNHLQQIETSKPCKGEDEDHMPNGYRNNINPHSHFTKEVFTKRKTNWNMKRSGSLGDGGFLLKIVFPFEFRSKVKKQVVLNESCKVGSSPRSSSVRAWDGLCWFGETESIGRQRTSSSKSNIKPFGSCRSSSKNNNREQSSGIFLTGCLSVFSSKKKFDAG